MSQKLIIQEMSRMHVVHTSNLAFFSGKRGVRDSDGQEVQETP